MVYRRSLLSDGSARIAVRFHAFPFSTSITVPEALPSSGLAALLLPPAQAQNCDLGAIVWKTNKQYSPLVIFAMHSEEPE